MRKDVFLTLDQYANRPVFDLPEHKDLTALLDTGARFPVWTSSTKLLEAHGGKLFKKNVPYSGIGGADMVPCTIKWIYPIRQSHL